MEYMSNIYYICIIVCKWTCKSWQIKAYTCMRKFCLENRCFIYNWLACFWVLGLFLSTNLFFRGTRGVSVCRKYHLSYRKCSRSIVRGYSFCRHCVNSLCATWTKNIGFLQKIFLKILYNCIFFACDIFLYVCIINIFIIYK